MHRAAFQFQPQDTRVIRNVFTAAIYTRRSWILSSTCCIGRTTHDLKCDWPITCCWRDTARHAGDNKLRIQHLARAAAQDSVALELPCEAAMHLALSSLADVLLWPSMAYQTSPPPRPPRPDSRQPQRQRALGQPRNGMGTYSQLPCLR